MDLLSRYDSRAVFCAALLAAAVYPYAASAVNDRDCIAIVHTEVTARPDSAPAVITRVLTENRDQSSCRPGEVTAAAIKALGAKPDAKKIAKIVYAAVHARPQSVQEIVHFAVLASPAEAAEQIVGAAILAVPDPWKIVNYRKLTSGGMRLAGAPSDGKEIVGKEIVGKEVLPSGDGRPMTEAEAIVQTALDANPGLDTAAMFAAADAALRGDPTFMVAAMSDPRGVSGVGDAGNNNYANEPGRKVKAPPLGAVSP